MTFAEIELTDSLRDAQGSGQSTESQASVRLERAAMTEAAEVAFATNLLSAWLIAANWYANWPEEASNTVIAGSASFACPNVDPSAPASRLRAECLARLNTLRAATRTPWLAQAWSNTEQCQGVFGAAQLQMSISDTSVDLWFDKHVADKALAHEMLDTLSTIATALQSDDSLTPRELVELARPLQTNSELVGQLQGIPDQDVLDAFNAHVARAPEKAAICEAGISVSYGHLSMRVQELAAELERVGVASGGRVALCMPRSSSFIIAALAVLSLEAIYIPIDVELPAERRNLMMDDARVGWVIDSDCAVQRARPAAETMPDNGSGCGYVLFTSGTTGRPKGVMVSRASLSYYASVARHTFKLSHQSRVLQFATVSFDASVEEIYPCLMAGGTVVIRDPSVDLRPALFLEFLHQQKITFLDLPTGYWRELSLACASGNLHFPPSVQLVVIGGEALYKSDIHAWFRLPAPRPVLINSYGPTETTVVTALQRVRLPAANDGARNDISIGRPIAGSRIVLLDRFDRPAPLGGLGQICISSPGVAVGYLNSREMTDEKFFVQVESDRSQRRYYKSGDLGRIGAEGALEYHGRLDSVVKRQGFRISLGEIESIIRTLPEVSDCCVLMTEAGSNAKLVCAVQLIPDAAVSHNDLRQQLILDLPSYMVPNSFVLLDEIPRNLAGKVDYNKVKALTSKMVELKPDGNTDYPAESPLIAGICSILGARNLNWDHSLAENGADSLECVRLAMFLERHTGQPWPISSLHSYTSVRMIVNDANESRPAQCATQHFRDWRYTELDRLKGLIRLGKASPARIEDGILVTGATGLLGRHVVKELLKKTTRPIVCLVRNPSGQPLESLTQAHLHKLNASNDELQRLRIVVGDLSRDNLGLDELGMQHLQRSISDIVHCAADTNMLSPYSALLTTNVLGSVALINLALSVDAAFHFVSSLALFDITPPLPQVSPTTNIADVGNVESGYLQGKWMIEMLLAQLRNAGLRATTYRCGRLWGSAEHLAEAGNDYVFQFLDVCRRLEQFPVMPMQLEVCPVDRIASHITSSVTAPSGPSANTASTYHLCSSKSYAMDDIYQAMRLQVPDLARVNAETWLAALSAHVQANPLDLPAMRVFAVVQSLSLDGCIDNLVVNESTPSSHCCEQGLSLGLTAEQIVQGVMTGSTSAVLRAQIAAHG